MDQDSEVTGIGKPSTEQLEPLTWLQTWLLACFQPTYTNFQRIAYDPNATIKRSILWVFAGSLIGLITRTLVSGWFGQQEKPEGVEYILTGVSVVLSFILVAWLIHVIATKIFHGAGAYSSLANAFAAFYAPYLLISGAISGIPYINFLAILPILIFITLVYATAISAVYGIRRWKSTVAFIASLALVVVITVVVTLCTLTFIGPDLLDEFQKINMELEA